MALFRLLGWTRNAIFAKRSLLSALRSVVAGDVALPFASTRQDTEYSKLTSAAARYCLQVRMQIMRWLRRKFDFGSSSNRRALDRLSKVIKVTVTKHGPLTRTHADLICLFIPQYKQPGRDVGRRAVVMQSNGSRTAVAS